MASGGWQGNGNGNKMMATTPTTSGSRTTAATAAAGKSKEAMVGKGGAVYADLCLICNAVCCFKERMETEDIRTFTRLRQLIYSVYSIPVGSDVIPSLQDVLPFCSGCLLKLGNLKTLKDQLADIQKQFNFVKEDIAFAIVDSVAASGRELCSGWRKTNEEMLKKCFVAAEVDTIQQIIFDDWHDKSRTITLSNLIRCSPDQDKSTGYPNSRVGRSTAEAKFNGNFDDSNNFLIPNTTPLRKKPVQDTVSVFRVPKITPRIVKQGQRVSAGTPFFTPITPFQGFSKRPALPGPFAVRGIPKLPNAANGYKNGVPPTSLNFPDLKALKAYTDQAILTKIPGTSSLAVNKEMSKEKRTAPLAAKKPANTNGNDTKSNGNNNGYDVPLKRRKISAYEKFLSAYEYGDRIVVAPEAVNMRERNVGDTDNTQVRKVDFLDKSGESYRLDSFLEGDSGQLDEGEANLSQLIPQLPWTTTVVAVSPSDIIDNDMEEHADGKDIEQLVTQLQGEGSLSGEETTECLKYVKNNEGLYVCYYCNKTFIHKYPYRDHVKTHTGEGPVCSVCGKIFPKNQNLVLHLRTHTGERPFTCTVCSKGFADKSNLKVHYRVHTGERPYKCEYCDECFISSSKLAIHRCMHADKPFICAVCDDPFATADELLTHVKTHEETKHHDNDM